MCFSYLLVPVKLLPKFSSLKQQLMMISLSSVSWLGSGRQFLLRTSSCNQMSAGAGIILRSKQTANVQDDTLKWLAVDVSWELS